MAVKPKILTGARAILKMAGADGSKKIVAFGTNVGYRIAIPHAPINVLGRYSAARHEPLGYDVTVNCGVLRFIEDDLVGNAPDNPGTSIQPRVQEIMNHPDIEIEILDRKSGKSIVTVGRARLTDRGGNVGARDLLTENWTFVGIIAQSGDSGAQHEAEGANVEAAAETQSEGTE